MSRSLALLWALRRAALLTLLLPLLHPLASTAQPLPPLPALPPLPQRVVAPTDQAEFRRLVLDNGLRVLLSSDPRFNKSAAALVVDVGQIDDPLDTEGMAHFLEHMLFLGTAKYPDEGEYRRFMQANGGTNNAYTASDHTNYSFDVRHEALAQALDRFAQFFIAPSFNPAFVAREVNAVHNEAMRHLQNDFRRDWSVRRELYLPGSGESKFSTGNKDTLARATPQAVRAFYEQHYSAHRMALAITGRASLDELERLARQHFSAVPRREVSKAPHEPSFQPRKAALRMAFVEPARELRQLNLEFVVPATRPMFASRSDTLLDALLERGGPGGLQQRLKDEGLANAVGSSIWERTPQYGSLRLTIDLTPDGEREHQRVLGLVFSYLDFLRRAPFPQALFDDSARVGALKETFADRGEGRPLAIQLANQALFYPLEVAERARSAWGAPDEAAYRRLLEMLRPDNLLVTLMARGLPIERKDRIYGVGYAYREDAGAAYAALLQPRTDNGFALPAPNRFMPAATPLLPERAQALINEPGLVLHYAPDGVFQRPQTALLMRFVPVRELASVESAALLGLWSKSLQEALAADLADAGAAGVETRLELTLEGLRLTLVGYGDSPARVARHLAARLRNFDPGAARFADLREQRVRELASYAQTEAFAQARDRRDAMQREFAQQPLDLLPRTRSATWPEVQRFGQRLLARGRLEMLVHGHLSPEDASATAREVAGAVAATAARPHELLRRRHLVMAPGENLVDAVLVEGVNAAWIGDYLFAEDTPALRATSLVISAFVGPLFFTELRTRQQLGYIVGGGASGSLRERFLTFTIQSSSLAASELRDRAERFIATLPAALAALNDADWATLKAGVRSRLDEKPTGIAERAERLFSAAYGFNGDWAREQATLAALQALTREEAVRVLTQTVDSSSARRRNLLVDPGARAPSPPVAASFADREAWKKTREYR